MDQEQTETEEETGGALRGKLEDTLDENTVLRRRLAFVEAGVNPDSDEAKIISNNMGDLDVNPENVQTTLDMVRNTFATSTDETTPEPEPDPEAADDRQRAKDSAQARRDLTGQGGDPMPEPPERDSVDSAFEAKTRMLRDGVPREDANSAVTRAIFEDAVANGNDSPFVWEGWDRHTEKESQRVR
jgi:hypothetical protein